MTLFNPALSAQDLTPRVRRAVETRDAAIQQLIDSGFQVTYKSTPDPRLKVIKHVMLENPPHSAMVLVVPTAPDAPLLINVQINYVT